MPKSNIVHVFVSIFNCRSIQKTQWLEFVLLVVAGMCNRCLFQLSVHQELTLAVRKYTNVGKIPLSHCIDISLQAVFTSLRRLTIFNFCIFICIPLIYSLGFPRIIHINKKVIEISQNFEISREEASLNPPFPPLQLPNLDGW